MGTPFDPRTVELKFDLQGANGIYLPLAFDIREDTLHWLDVYSKGQFEFNNVESSKSAIFKICPDLIEYFASGVRTSVYKLALLHASARGEQVLIRGEQSSLYVRKAGESHESFLDRLRNSSADVFDAPTPGPDDPPVFALLYRGDLELAEESSCYVLFPDKITGTISASDLVS